MKRSFLGLLFIFIVNFCFAQQGYWQQKVDFTIDVSLDDVNKTLTGVEQIVYKNNSQSSLDFIWFHIYPNAYKQETTALFQQIKNDPSRSSKLKNIEKGNIDELVFKAGGKTLTIEPHSNPQYIDVIKVKLNEPLKPGASLTLQANFKVKLPSYFSRSGFADGEFMVTQWYPKPAVFDKDGWHEFPYLDMGEFYSEYGDYKVNITLPSTYIVGATGVLQTADELAQYKSTGAKNLAEKSDQPALYKAKDPKGKKTLTYVMDNVPDFAWFADKNFVIQYDTLKLSSNKVVDVFTYYHNKKKTIWAESAAYAKDATKKYSEWIGEYEYPVVQVIEGPKNNASGGMEYPTITLITSPDAKPQTLDAVITHEVGHNWFMSMLGSNERIHSWQDEGLNSYFQFRYEAEKYKSNSIFGDAIPAEVKSLSVSQFQQAVYNAMMNIPMDLVIDKPASEYKSSDDYAMASYLKTALWLFMLESTAGRDKVDAGFKVYFAEWKNKHPSPADFKAALEKATGMNLTEYFGLLKSDKGFKK